MKVSTKYRKVPAFKSQVPEESPAQVSRKPAPPVPKMLLPRTIENKAYKLTCKQGKENLETRGNGEVFFTLYFVQSTDNLTGIAELFKVPLRQILEANQEIRNPNVIYPGQLIFIPDQPVYGPPATFFEYMAQPGDTLARIAHRFGASLEGIMRMNPLIKKPRYIFPGQLIFVPTGALPPAPNIDAILYFARRGDTLPAIARRFKVEVKALRDANPEIAKLNAVYPGQQLVIPVSGQPHQIPSGFTQYIVQIGDTMNIIARRFKTNIARLLEYNPDIVNPNFIVRGQVIAIPAV